MDAVMLQLTRARNRLTTPATLTLPEIAASGLTRMFAPALPSDLLVNVYINLNKLCLTVYQLHALQPNSTKVNRTLPTSVPHPRPHGPMPCSSEGLTGSGALLPRTSAQLEAPCSTARGPCCKYASGRAALEHPLHPSTLHLRGWGLRNPPLSPQ
uniref:Protein rogdi homolog n=1 Tax=Rousettus aegyptiacus TaxID=9407 RepID=A0A7J8F425_ROUAE|nr:rogdi atypical leucine zipper [Rousettus aegyptiacus]